MIGCGGEEMWIATRANDYLTLLPWTTFEFAREVDTITSARVVASVADLDEGCCAALGDVGAWSHKLVIRRDDRIAWEGPIIEPIFGDDAVELFCHDLMFWFERRLFREIFTTHSADLADIFSQYVAHAMVEDAVPGLAVSASRTGIVGTRTVSSPRVADELRELARSGLDFTAVGDRIYVGGEEIPTQTELVVETSDLVSPRIRQLGLQSASRVRGFGGPSEGSNVPVSVVEGAVSEVMGLVENSFEVPSIPDETSLRTAAISVLDMANPTPETVEGVLNPDSALSLADLIPGTRWRARVATACRRVDMDMRLKRVSVRGSQSAQGAIDEIHATWIPRGTTEVAL